jgi:hypothetical protein
MSQCVADPIAIRPVTAGHPAYSHFPRKGLLPRPLTRRAPAPGPGQRLRITVSRTGLPVSSTRSRLNSAPRSPTCTARLVSHRSGRRWLRCGLLHHRGLSTYRLRLRSGILLESDGLGWGEGGGGDQWESRCLPSCRRPVRVGLGGASSRRQLRRPPRLPNRRLTMTYNQPQPPAGPGGAAASR